MMPQYFGQGSSKLKAFISYSHKDEKYVERLHVHLAQISRQGMVDAWYDRAITVGGVLDNEIDMNLEGSDIFLAVVSPDFIASGYCYDKEMTKAIKMHDAGEIIIVPLIVEPCDWINTPLQRFRATPKDGKAVSEWSNQNSAFLDVVSDLRKVFTNVNHEKSDPSLSISEKVVAAVTTKASYRTKKDFDKIDRIQFKKAAFQTIAETLESYCVEANEIQGIRALFEGISKNRFFITLVNKDKSNRSAERSVYISDDGVMNGINFLHGRSNSSNSSNGMYGIEADDYDLFLKPIMGFSNRDDKMSPVDVAADIWHNLMRSVGIEYAN
ncbi:MAG: toll/interleukin-1 receptor domain-containing protein [Litorimonas sp.]